MPTNMIIRHCSPTLAGIKLANLFTYVYQTDALLLLELEKWNQLLNNKGIYFLVLAKKDHRALIYVYRRKHLQAMLYKKPIADFLAEYGYLTSNVDHCIRFLAYRILNEQEFPHEIGVFLGYPLNDIKGFIANKGSDYKCVGFWKVYGNETDALKTFAKFRKCKDIYSKRHQQGFDITRLTVAV